MSAYYNEIDPQKAAWLRELIAVGAVAPGEVDERPIQSVSPGDLRGYRQCHFFAGIGIWSYALRLAGWADDRPVWTGSCPCPSFSAAGKGKGFDDPRHLWPEWYRLIRECRPPVIFGEQVDGAIGHGWLDLVGANLEDEDYAIGAAVLGACSVGAPHRRYRLWFVAEHAGAGGEPGGVADIPRGGCREFGGENQPGSLRHVDGGDTAGGVVHDSSGGFGGRELPVQPRQQGERHRADAGRPSGTGELELPYGGLTQQPSWEGAGPRLEKGPGAHSQPPGPSDLGELELSSGIGRQRGEAPEQGHELDRQGGGWPESEHGAGVTGAYRSGSGRPGPVNGFWGAADWLRCTDGKWRPVESPAFGLADGAALDLGFVRDPGSGELFSFPLQVGAKTRTLRLRGYGDGIVAQVAAEFIGAYTQSGDGGTEQ